MGSTVFCCFVCFDQHAWLQLEQTEAFYNLGSLIQPQYSTPKRDKNYKQMLQVHL